MVAGLLSPWLYDRLAAAAAPGGAYDPIVLAGAWFFLTLGVGLVLADVMIAWDEASGDLDRRDRIFAACALRMFLALVLVGATRRWMLDHPVIVLADLGALFALSRWRPFDGPRAG